MKCSAPSPLENEGVWSRLFYNLLIINILKIQWRQTCVCIVLEEVYQIVSKIINDPEGE